MVDQRGIIFAVRAKLPNAVADKGWNLAVVEALETFFSRLKGLKDGEHRRGQFQVFTKGASFGGGQKVGDKPRHASLLTRGLRCHADWLLVNMTTSSQTSFFAAIPLPAPLLQR